VISSISSPHQSVRHQPFKLCGILRFTCATYSVLGVRLAPCYAVKQRDYSKEIVEAARSVLLEIMRILGEYKEDIAVVGGWVPELLLTEAEVRHIGSIDVDLVLNHGRLNEVGYKTILELLLSHGYKQGEQPFVFSRNVILDGREIKVEVDFLAGEYGGTGKNHRTQKAQDMRPRKARGADLVFMLPELISIHGQLPGGGDDSTEIICIE